MLCRRAHEAAWLRRLAGPAALVTASLVMTFAGLALPALAASLASPAWTVSDPSPGATGVAYAYTFTTATTSPLDTVTMTVPAGTTGTPAVGTVTPASVAAGAAVSLTGNTLTYTFTPATIAADTEVSIQLTGLTNTATPGSYTADITTSTAGTPVDTATTPAVDLTGALASPDWTVSSAAPGATAVSYTYSFTAATTSSLDSVTMTVPAGTAGTPAVGTVTPAPVAAGGAVSLSGDTLTYTFTPATITAGTAISIQLTGLTNTTTPGSYTADITTSTAGTPVDTATTPAVDLTGALASPDWTVSSAAAGATGVSYTYTFTTATTSSLDSVTMTVPAGTAGTPAVGTVTPAPVAAGGTVSLSGDTLTYTFTPATITAGTAVSIQLTALTNTATSGSYTAQITTFDGTTAVDSGTTPAATITGALASPDWRVSTAAPDATGVTYAYTFTTATDSSLSSVTMTVPAGTAGTPAVGTVTPAPVAAGGTVSLSGDTLTYTFTPATISAGTAVSIQLTGLTNTTTPGSYTSAISTFDGGSLVDAGTTPAISFPASLTLTGPSSLTWAATDSGLNQSAVDTVAADQQLTVDDATGAGAGWHITVSATTFTDGTHTLPDAGSLDFTGSISALTGATPSAACAGSCTLPSDTTTYPVAITTAASSPDAFTIYAAAPNTGVGVVTLGGHNATHPIGWWIQMPGAALAGSYTSTLTVTLVSGP